MKIIALAVVLLLVIGGVVWFFFIRQSTPTPTPTAEPTETPTETPTPTPPPPTLEQNLAPIEPLAFTMGTNGSLALTNAIKNQPVSMGQVRTFGVTDQTTPPVPYTFALFSNGMNLHAPSEYSQAADPQAPVYVALFGKSNNTVGRAFIVKISNPGLAQVGLQRWEPTMPQDLKNLFQINTTKSSAPTFVDATYNGVAIRYRNFPDSLQSIDYAIVTTPDGMSYAVFANSKDEMFALIDRMLNATLGK